MPKDYEVFQPMTNLTWRCGKCGRTCSAAFIDCAGCGEARPEPDVSFTVRCSYCGQKPCRCEERGAHHPNCHFGRDAECDCHKVAQRGADQA